MDSLWLYLLVCGILVDTPVEGEERLQDVRVVRLNKKDRTAYLWDSKFLQCTFVVMLNGTSRTKIIHRTWKTIRDYSRQKNSIPEDSSAIVCLFEAPSHLRLLAVTCVDSLKKPTNTYQVVLTSRQRHT